MSSSSVAFRSSSSSWSVITMTRTREEKEKLFMENRGLVPFVIKKYTIPAHVDYDDVLQVGYMALWRGVDNDGYDPSKGKPSTYFFKYVENDIRRYLWGNAHNDGFEVCPETRRQSNKAYELRRQGLSDAEIADAMNEGRPAKKRVTVDRVKAMERLLQPADKLFRTMEDGTEYDNPKLPKVTDAAGYAEIENDELHSALEIAMDEYLTDSESTVIRMLFGLEGDGMTMRDVAREMGKSESWANIQRNRGLAKLRHPRCSKALNDYR